MRLLSVLLEAALAPLLVSAQCNIQDATDNLFSSVLPSTIRQDDVKLTRFSEIDNSGEFEVVQSSTPGVTGHVWFLEQERVTDGWRIIADFLHNDGESDGFAVVIQNDKITNVFASGGSNLGFRNGLDNYLAVSFDTCSNRDEDETCGEYLLSIVSKQPNQDPVVLGSITLNRADRDFANGQTQNMVIEFLQDQGDFGAVDVSLANTLRLSANLENDLEETLGSKFATVGVTGSNSANVPATITIRRFVMQVMNSGHRLAETLTPLQQVIFGRQVSFDLVLTDSCNQILSEELAALENVTPEDISATLTEQIDANPIVIESVTTQLASNRFQIAFAMPSNVLADWTMNVSLDGVLSQQMPFINALTTNEPDEGGLSQQGLILLICLVTMLVVITVYMVRRLDYFRKKLIQHEEDIDYGKVKEEVDRIDQTISYQMNPMIAPLDEMQEKLDYNNAMLEKMRSGQENAMDANFTVDQLVAENEKLRLEMNRLKKEEQMREAGDRQATGRRKLGGGGAAHRRDFDQERA